MTKKRAKNVSFAVKEMDLKEAKRVFNRKRGQASKYDEIIDKAEKLTKGKALIVEGMTYSEVNGLRKRIADYLENGWDVSATNVDPKKELYDVLVQRGK